MKIGDRRNGVAVHAWDTGHSVNWDGTEVLEQESNYWKRKTMKPSGFIDPNTTAIWTVG